MTKLPKGFKRLKKARIVYKKGRLPVTRTPCIIRLRLPVGTLVYEPSPAGLAIHYRKCRADRATVMDITSLTSPRSQLGDEARPLCRIAHGCIYRKGRRVRPHAFSRDEMHCAPGLHYFRRRSDAVAFYL